MRSTLRPDAPATLKPRTLAPGEMLVSDDDALAPGVTAEALDPSRVEACFRAADAWAAVASLASLGVEATRPRGDATPQG